MISRYFMTLSVAMVLAAVAVVAAIAAQPKAAGAADTVAVPGCTGTDVEMDANEKAMLDLHNQKRADKGRDADKPLQVLFPTLPALLTTLGPPPRLSEALLRLLPGPVTVVVPYPDGFRGPAPGRAADGSPTLGVRVPRWPRTAVAMSWIGAPLVASSANPSGGRPPRRLGDVDPAVAGACDLLLDGGEVSGTASTVIDLSRYADDGGWTVLREGALGVEAVAAALGRPPEDGRSRLG